MASSNRSNRRGRTTSPPCWHAPATRSRPCGRAMPTVRCRCCGCPSGATTSPPSSATPRLLRDNTSDVVFLGTGGSSLGGQTLAQLAGHAVPGVGALRDPPRVHFMDNLDPDSYATLLERLPLKTSRFVAVSKSGGTGETLMQTIAALDAVKAAKLDPRRAFPRHHRAGQARQVERAARSARRPPDPHDGSRPRRRRPLLGADQCRPAARRGVRPRHRRDPRRAPPMRWRPCWRASRRPTCRPRSARRSRLRSPRDKTIAVMMAYADRLAAVHQMVRAALGREPRQGRQGHHADRRARPGRPAQPASALHRRPARQAVHRRHRFAGRPRPAHGRGARQACRRARLRRQDHRRSRRRAGPRHRRDARQERLPGAHHPSASASTSGISANC